MKSHDINKLPIPSSVSENVIIDEDAMPTDEEWRMMSYEEKLQFHEIGFMKSFRQHHKNSI